MCIFIVATGMDSISTIVLIATGMSYLVLDGLKTAAGNYYGLVLVFVSEVLVFMHKFQV